MIIFKGKKFSLRTIRASDKFDIAKNINDKIIHRNTAAIPYPYKLKDAENWVKKCLSEKRKKDFKILSFFIVIGGEVVGSVGFHDIEKGFKAEIGYWLARKYWGNGIVSEAVRIVTEFGFQKLKLRRIYAKVYSFNAPSMRVLEKNGYQLEGICKKDVLKDRKLFDSFLYAKIKK